MIIKVLVIENKDDEMLINLVFQVLMAMVKMVPTT
jgi:hypothetical protein